MFRVRHATRSRQARQPDVEKDETITSRIYAVSHDDMHIHKLDPARKKVQWRMASDLCRSEPLCRATSGDDRHTYCGNFNLLTNTLLV